MRPSGLTQADLAKVARDARTFAALPHAGQVIGPVPAKDGKAAEILIEAHLGYSNAITNFVNKLNSVAGSGDSGLHAYVTGPAASAADSVKIFKGIDSTLLYATLAVVIVLLLLTYRSPVLWLLPIISAGVALTAAEAVIYLLIQHARPGGERAERGHPGGAGARRVAPTTRCCWSPGTGRNCAGMRTGTRPWRWPCAGPGRPSSPAG